MNEGRFPAASSRFTLYSRVWPAPEPTAALLLVHGLGEHCGRYARLAGELAAHGVTTFGFDQRGHGRSGGRRGHVDRFERFLDDLDRAAEQAQASAGGRPLFMMGHSFGGLVALRWLQTRTPRLQGSILSAPLLAVALQPPRWKTALSGALSRWLPAFPFSSGIDPAQLSRDSAYVRSYREDPLVHDRITPRLYTEMMDAAMCAVREPVPALPLLFIVPGADRIVLPEAALRLGEGLAGDVTVRHYPEARHEAFNDLERAAVVADITGWLGEHQ